MKAIVQERYGTPDDLAVREVPRPSVGEGEVLVRVRASSVHPDVWHVVTGRPRVLRVMGGGLLRPRHAIPGTDAAGVVESVGTGVTRFREGDEVFGETRDDHQWTHGGAWAEYVAVREEWLARKPTNVTFEQAASVPSSGYIALLNFREARRLPPGRRVLVNGAGGGVGSIALQMAKARDARVTAVDAPGKLEMLRDLGADEVVDYTEEDFTRRGIRYDLIVDVPGNRPFSEVRRALEPDGRYIPIGHEHFGATGHRLLGLLPHFFWLLFLSRFVGQLQGPDVPAPTREEAMAVLAELLEDGTLTPVIDSVFPLRDAARALRHMAETETRGKVIVVPD